MSWKHWMILELVEVENYAERIEKMNEFIEFMEGEELFAKQLWGLTKRGKEE